MKIKKIVPYPEQVCISREEDTAKGRELYVTHEVIFEENVEEEYALLTEVEAGTFSSYLVILDHEAEEIKVPDEDLMESTRVQCKDHVVEYSELEKRLKI